LDYRLATTSPERTHVVPSNQASCSCLIGVIERSAGRRYADLVSELLWRPMGVMESTYITVVRLGAPRAAGGLCATVGQVVTDRGSRGSRRIIPAGWIEDILHDGHSVG
jgi:CubicO group peptidase (beta-lactamase class C family)